MLKIIGLIGFCFVTFNFSLNAQEKTSETNSKVSEKKANQRPADAATAEPFDKTTVEVMKEKCVSLETDAGVVELEMFPESAPETVRNFLNLTATGAFDTTKFSRVVPDFVVQGGNLFTRDTMTEKIAVRARKTIPDEPNQILHQRGIVSMARPDEPNAASTNFFILLSDAPYLDGKFAAFGRVTRGMETVDAINKMPVDGDKPQKPVRIKRAIVAVCPVKSDAGN